MSNSLTLFTQNYPVQFYNHFNDILKEFIENLQNKNQFVFIIDENFFHLWKESIHWILQFPYYLVPSGEQYKNLQNLEKIWKFFYENQIDRQTIVVGWGGGVVGDLAGFAAATYLRGLPFFQIPTTLLSMVDSSIGSKTAIDFLNAKNLIGAFYSPKKVFICPQFLTTLPQRQMLCGQAEMFKHAIIHSKNHLQQIDNIQIESIFNSLKIKKYFVEKDPYEKNIRKKLNFGHTIGHALESFAIENYLDLLHGEAVFWGMLLEMYFFKKIYLISEKIFFLFLDLIQPYINKIVFNPFQYPAEDWFRYIKQDKKRLHNGVDMTLILKIGTSKIINIEISKLEVILKDIIHNHDGQYSF